MVIKYPELLTQIKQRIRQGQVRAIMAANAEMIALYWDIGQLIAVRQHLEGWGAAVIPRLARDLHNELPEVKGFSERNIKLMVQFYREYPELFPNGQLPVAQKAGQVLSDDEQVKSALMQRLVAQIPWSHNVLLLQKVKDIKARVWTGRVWQVIENLSERLAH
jgi:predicted nuclease of restriction endonuclease-like (RecB) superfamily